MKTYLKLLLLCALFYAIGQPRAVAVTQTVTICDGTQTNNKVPFFYGSIAASGDASQVIYPKSKLNLPIGSEIKKITLHANGSIAQTLKDNTIRIRMGNVSKGSSVATNADEMASYRQNMTLVYDGNFASSGEYSVEYNLTNTIEYSGEDLIVEFEDVNCSKRGSSINWLGLAASENCAVFYDGYYKKVETSYAFLPQITITYEIDAEIPTATVTPSTLNFQDAEAGYSVSEPLTITNTSANLAIEPTLSISGNSVFTINTSELPATLAPGASVVIPVTYSPTCAGTSHNATVTLNYKSVADISVSGAPVTASLTGNAVQPRYFFSATPAEGTVNFGKIIVGQDTKGNDRQVTKTITITNVGKAAWSINQKDIVIAGDGFTMEANQTNTNVAANGGQLSFDVTFKPTEAKAYEGTLKITPYDGRTVTWFLMGEGSDAQATMFDNKTYAWPFNADASEQTTSYMSEIATDPDQMIALCRAVYMNTDIPGNINRGYTQAGDKEGTVSYRAVGKVARNHHSDDNQYHIEYVNSYGWDINTNKPIVTSTGTTSRATYKYLDPTEYQPTEGVTLLMVELNDGVLPSTVSASTTDYASLRNVFAKMFKSVRVVKDFTKVGAGTDKSGYLFKVDADQLNRFFFLAKGRLRRNDESSMDAESGLNWGECYEPSFRYKSGETEADGTYISTSANEGPFYDMFEQLSPVALSNQSAITDAYHALINLTSYSIEHDCISVPFTSASSSVEGVTPGHEFNMYGPKFESQDCQDVRDLMLLVPDRRMTWWSGSSTANSGRDGSTSETPTYDMYQNYHKDYAPKMGLLSIVQEPITGVKKGSEDVYQLTLSWKSNLLDYLPGGDGKFVIYQVINENGVERYVKIAERTATRGEGEEELYTYKYVDVAMQEHGQQVTYVIQAVDNSVFLTSQMSNKQSYIIPGTNPAEMLQLVLSDDYTSRFDPEREKNYYSNGLQINAYDLMLRAEYLSASAQQPQFSIYRTSLTPQRDEEGNVVTDGNNIVYNSEEIKIATASVVADNKLNIDFVEGTQTARKDFPTGTQNTTFIPAGYHDNKATATYTVENGYVKFDNFVIYDNFEASIASNNHPTEYDYQVKLNTARAFDEAGNSEVTSNKAKAFVHKTNMEMAGVLSLAQVNADGANGNARSELTEGVKFGIEVKYASRTELYRYDAYRWNRDENSKLNIIREVYADGSELDYAPNGEADNGGDGGTYSLTMNNHKLPDVTVKQGETAQAWFIDDHTLTNAGNYVYAPVVETMKADGTYNTYGAPLKSTVSGTLEVVGGTPEMSKYTWYDKGEWCSYYNIPLKFTALNIPEGYELYKVRAWRQVDNYENVLREEMSERKDRISADYLYEDMNYGTNMNGKGLLMSKATLQPDGGYLLGSRPVPVGETNVDATGTAHEVENETTATFGARRLKITDNSQSYGREGTLEELKAHFVVRAYFTREENPAVKAQGSSNAPRHAEGTLTPADYDYYVAEGECDVTIKATEGIVTGISTPVQDRSCDVVGVTYVNPMGQTSSRPFGGVNIIVTRYSDGTTKTTKAVF